MAEYLANSQPQKHDLLCHCSRYMILYTVFAVIGVAPFLLYGYYDGEFAFMTSLFSISWIDVVLLGILLIGTLTFFLPALAAISIAVRGVICGIRITDAAVALTRKTIFPKQLMLLLLTEILNAFLLCMFCSFCRTTCYTFRNLSAPPAHKKKRRFYVSGALLFYLLVASLFIALSFLLHFTALRLWNCT